MAEVEKLITLLDGRTLAYSDIGDPSSSTVVLFYHGVFGVGRATRIAPVFQQRSAHFIAPTLCGWGLSSPHPPSMSFAACLLADTAELINHTHPNDANLRIYVAGGSYGTVPAQILYGAPFDAFPLGRHIVGCLLVAPFSPFRWHEGYSRTLSWSNYLGVGPPAIYIPFHVLPRLIAMGVRSKMKTVDSAESFIRGLLFDPASDAERAAFTRWREEKGIAEGEFERQMGENAVKSLSKTNAGFLEVAEVLHSDWGFRPDQLDGEHTKRPLLAVIASGDEMASPDLARWLVKHYANAHLKEIRGGHIAALYELDEIWRELVDLTERT